MRIRKIIIFIFAVATLAFFYLTFFHSPKVLAVHGSGSGSNKELLVNNIPLTDRNKIKWWDNNGAKTISSPRNL